MYLDVLLCKVVNPTKATWTYDVDEFPSLARIQETGIVNVQERLIGRNCMKKKWHKKHNKAVNSGVDNAWQDMVVIFPDEVRTKLLPYIRNRRDNDVFFDLSPEEPFDFIFISW